MLKFRSMRPDAEELTGPVLASEDDPRVTRVGRFLRKTRIDEVPQFINVFLGDMSIVGPRPERPELAEQLAHAIPYFEERMRDVKPGITGLAQVTLGYTGKPPPGSELDLFEQDLTNPFKVDGAEDALADHMRMKLLYDLAYTAAHGGSAHVRAARGLHLAPDPAGDVTGRRHLTQDRGSLSPGQCWRWRLPSKRPAARSRAPAYEFRICVIGPVQ